MQENIRGSGEDSSPACCSRHVSIFSFDVPAQLVSCYKKNSEKNVLSYNIITHPPDPLPPTIIQWCVVLSRSAIGVLVIVIAAIVVAPLTAMSFPASTVALPQSSMTNCRRCCHRERLYVQLCSVYAHFICGRNVFCNLLKPM